MKDLTDTQRQELEKYLLAREGRQAPPKPRGGGCFGCLRSIVGIVVVLLLAAAFVIVADYLDAPWSWALNGKPTLTGEWVGSFRMPQGQAGIAYLNLTHDHNLTYDVRDSFSIHHLPPFGGNAQGCIGKSAVQSYSLYGGATSDGKDVEMVLQALKPTVPNFALHELKGAWDGVSLTLAGTATTILDSKGSTESNSELNQRQPTTITFRKAGQSDFEKACQKLGQ